MPAVASIPASNPSMLGRWDVKVSRVMVIITGELDVLIEEGAMVQ